MAEKPPLPDEIRAVLDRCVGEMKERLILGLDCAETQADKLDVLARFAREIDGVRGETRREVSVKARVGAGKRLALVGGLLAVFGAGVVTTLLSQDKQQAAPVAGPKECPPCPKESDPDKESGGAGEPVPVRPPVVDPPGIHGLPSPEAAGANSAAEGGKNASSTDAGLKASQEATERANKKIDLKQVVDMLKSGKNELRYDLSLAGEERLERALRDLEARLKELGVTQEEIDAIKGVPPIPGRSDGAKVEESSALGAAVQPDAGVAPDISGNQPLKDEPPIPVEEGTAPKPVDEDDIEYE